MIGFCEDFHFKPMQFGLEPFLFTVSRRSKPVPNHLYIRMAAGVATDRARDCFRRTILGFDPTIEPERIEPRFIDEELESNYQQERKLSTLVLLFSMLSILIAMMGVFGLVLFETQCRRREIGIRRVNGATVGGDPCPFQPPIPPHRPSLRRRDDPCRVCDPRPLALAIRLPHADRLVDLRRGLRCCHRHHGRHGDGPQLACGERKPVARDEGQQLTGAGRATVPVKNGVRPLAGRTPHFFVCEPYTKVGPQS